MSMRLLAIIILFIFSLFSCQKPTVISLSGNNGNKIMALQPLGQYNEYELEYLGSRLTRFFKIRVITLKAIDIPGTFSGNNVNRCSADSLLSLLSNIRNDSIAEVIGITHRDIYTIKSVEQKGIFGLGYIHDRYCVVSDYRLASNYQDVFYDRLVRVIIHEVGHNLGLKHCSDENCLMSEAYGNLTVLDKPGGDYCNKCRQKLK